MCGFTGFITTDQSVLTRAETTVKKMALAMKHRGPDDAGAWVEASSGIALGFRRLSILDLSSAGHQPMLSLSGRFVLTFNGEIYNHNELRELLSDWNLCQHAHPWLGHSDSETLLACIEAWGLEKTLQKTVGMFAIALWDTQTHTLQRALLLTSKTLYKADAALNVDPKKPNRFVVEANGSISRGSGKRSGRCSFV